MKRNLNENLAEKYEEEMNLKFQDEIIRDIYNKKPELNNDIKPSENIQKTQLKSFFIEKNKERNDGYFDKVDKMRNDQ